MRGFVGKVLFDTSLFIQIENNEQEYFIVHESDILEEAKGLLQPTLVIIKFLFYFKDKPEIIAFILRVFIRFYNSFPNLRSTIENPILTCLTHIVEMYTQIHLKEKKKL